MIDELHDKRTVLKFYAVAWSVQGKITRGQPTSVHVEAGPAVIGYETSYLLRTWFDASSVYGHQTQGAPEVKIFTGVAFSSHKNQLLAAFSAHEKPVSALYQRTKSDQTGIRLLVSMRNHVSFTLTVG
jgi:hypothetical protein